MVEVTITTGNESYQRHPIPAGIAVDVRDGYLLVKGKNDETLKVFTNWISYKVHSIKSGG